MKRKNIGSINYCEFKAIKSAGMNSGADTTTYPLKYLVKVCTQFI